jgi:membrane associated rhomboid family serine protease
VSVYDRDYFRAEEAGGTSKSPGVRQSLAMIPARWVLVSLLVLCFIAQRIAEETFGAGDVTRALGLSWEGLRSFHLWQPFTYGLLHDGAGHLFWNAVGLYVFTQVIEGSRRSEGIYVTALWSAVGGGLAYALWQAAGGGLNPGIPVVGASGAVTGLVVRALLTSPDTRLLLFFVLPVPLWAVALLYLIGDVLGLAGIGPASVAYIAHVGGALTAGLLHWKTVRGWRLLPGRKAGRTVLRPREPADFRPPQPNRSDIDEARVDLLLERIHANGMDSLTEEEKEFLKDVSRRMR